MGINLHEEREPSREVDNSDVTQMRTKMGHHSEETNELYNLMARHIKKRGEERINLYSVEDTADQKVNVAVMDGNDDGNLMDEQEMDQFILDNVDRNGKNVLVTPSNMRNIDSKQQSTSRGNSPPKEPTGGADN